MGRMTESISAINSAVRTFLVLVVVGGVGAGSWFAYSFLNANEAEAKRTAEALAAARGDLDALNRNFNRRTSCCMRKDAEITTLNHRVEEQKQEIERLDTSLRLMKVNHRVARMTVLDQTTDAETNRTVSLIEFQELNEDGQPVGEPRQFRIQGDVVYVDSWVVKFEDKYVEKAEIDRSTSLVLFRRIFGEFQEPTDGFALDQAGSTAGSVQSWRENVRTGETDLGGLLDSCQRRAAPVATRNPRSPWRCPFHPRAQGRVYRIELRASDGLSIRPEGQVEPPKPPTA